MGLLSRTIYGPSVYEAKGGKDQAGEKLWPELMARIDDCALPEDLDAFERWLTNRPTEYPAAWEEPLREVVAKRRQEIDEDDVATIMRRNFDF